MLSKRLLTIIDMVSPGKVPADIGTDHGYVPIRLVQRGICSRALAMDIREGPLERAAGHIREAGLEDRIILRQSDGLKQLRQGEADCIIITGMGGALIERILSQGEAVLESVSELVLSPQSEIARVRKWLLESRFVISDEDMIIEDGKFYTVIKAAAGDAGEGQLSVYSGDNLKNTADQENDTILIDSETECELEYGPVLLRKKHPCLKDYLDREMHLCKSIYYIISGYGRKENNQERLEEIQGRMEMLRLAETMMESFPETYRQNRKTLNITEEERHE